MSNKKSYMNVENILSEGLLTNIIKHLIPQSVIKSAEEKSKAKIEKLETDIEKIDKDMENLQKKAAANREQIRKSLEKT